jgi:hypothetical protein
MIRRCVEKLLLVLLIVIKKRFANNYRCRDNDVEILIPKAEGTSVAPKFRVGRATSLRAIGFGGQGTARPTCAAWRCRGGCVNRLCLGARRDECRYTDWGARARPRALPRKIGLTALCDP